MFRILNNNNLCITLYNIYVIETYRIGERWQYAVVPLNPVKSTTTDWSSYENYPYYTGSTNGMGVYGYAISGGTFFDTRSAAGGATALDNELERLDTCLGHSAPTIYQYHYHAVITFHIRNLFRLY